MQPGLHSAYRSTRKLLNFLEFVTFGIVKQDNDAVFVAELFEGAIELPYFLEPFILGLRRLAHCDRGATVGIGTNGLPIPNTD